MYEASVYVWLPCGPNIAQMRTPAIIWIIMQHVKRYSKSERWPCGFGPVVAVWNQWTAQGNHERNNLAWPTKSATYNEMRSLLVGSSVMQSRDLVSVSRRVSRTVFCSLGLGLEGFWSQSRALRLETLHRLFFMTFCKKFLKTVKNDCSTFSRSKRSMAKLSLVLCYLRDGENNLPSTPFKIYTEFSTKCVRTNETAAHNLCNEMLRVLC